MKLRQLITFLKKRFDKESKILFKNTSWILGSNVIRSGLAFLRSIIVARGLGVEFYGIYVFITNFVITIQEFFNLNIDAGIIRYGAIYRNEGRLDKLVAIIKLNILSVLITSVLSISLIAVLVSFFYKRMIDQPGLELYIILYAIADLATFFDPLGKSMLRLYYKFKLNSIIQTLAAIIELLLIAGVVLIYKANLKAFMITLVVSKLITSIMYIASMIYELKDELLPHFSAKMSLIKDQYREIAGFITGNAMTRTLQTLVNRSDVVLLGALASPAAVAYYNLAKRMANMFMVIADPFAQGIYPQISMLLAQKRFRELKVMLVKVSRSAAIPLVILLPVLTLSYKSIILIFYGQQYVTESLTFLIFYIASTMATVFFWNHSFMLGIGYIRFRLLTYIIAIIIGVGIAVPLIPYLGEKGMALGSATLRIIVFASFSIVSFKYLNRKLKKQDVEEPTEET
ncbi:MAG: oligosaccharide flippase family protein [Bacteroidia bacterium]|nr:oligosaccharide flippase family protein [Bacteroidia bacterium]MCZ2277449.1 oligosaccharide flippase family protein [Bacteroidia bacterium]